MRQFLFLCAVASCQAWTLPTAQQPTRLSQQRLSVAKLTSWQRTRRTTVPSKTGALFMNPSSSSSPLSSQVQLKPGTAQLDKPWQDLGFEYRETRSHGRIVYRNGEWGELELVQVMSSFVLKSIHLFFSDIFICIIHLQEPYIQLHIGATAIHYGQTCFEGLKAFCHADGDVYLFRPDENAARMQSSCRRIVMPELSTDRFIDACQRVVQDNLDYVPPYGSNGALYIRPILFGSGARIGLQPADEYTFLLMVIPVGDYYKGGLTKAVHGLILQDYDRAAPRGVGHVKVGGNYAADLWPNMQAKQQGYPICLYLDAATQEYVEEFSTSNFVGIHHETKRYLTPKSPSVLPSITNKSLMTLARDVLGYTVEERPVALEELKEMDEVLAVGTAVVVTPVGSLTKLALESGEAPTQYQFGASGADASKGVGDIGEVTLRLYEHVRAIQNGEVEDKYGWNFKV